MKARYRTRQHKAAFRKKQEAKQRRQISRNKVLVSNLIFAIKRLMDHGFVFTTITPTPGPRQCSVNTLTAPSANSTQSE